jgi:Uroporphyrinogen decarboxylase (URO-D)
MDQIERINSLIDRIESELGSERNAEICAKWNAPEVQHTYMHPVPRRTGQIPIVADLECPLWAKVLNFNVKEFYTNPLTYLEKQLEMALFRYDVFRDDSGLGRTIAIWLGVNFEPSLLGGRSVYPDHFDPLIDRSSIIIKDEESLRELEAREIDIRNSGILGLAHEFYGRIKETLPPGWKVIFPDWVIGPFGVASCLRGYENILADLVLAPEFFVKILDVVGDKMIEYSQARAKFLGIKVERPNLHHDDVNGQNFSRKAYHKFVFPAEKRLNSFYGGFQYWHSCGNVENFIDDLLEFDNLVMLDCGGWNSLDVFLEAIQRKGINGIGIEKRFNPVRDVIGSDDRSIRDRIRGLYDAAGGNKTLNINFKIDGIGELGEAKEMVGRVNKFISISREFGY